jgi:uncharacterized protein (TIGR02246 family)
MDSDEQAIRALIAHWHEAARAADVDAILELMTPDVVFLVPGGAPIRGRDAFGHGLRSMLADYSIESGFDIQEIEVAGMFAYCWTQLTVTVLAKTGEVSARRSGTTLSIFRKGSDGEWLLARDANLLGPAS